MGWCGQGGVGILSGIGTHISPTPSPNHNWRSVVAALSRVGTTTSGLSTPTVGLRSIPGGTPGRPQSTLTRHLICSGYPPKLTERKPLSGRKPHYGCDPSLIGGLCVHILAAKTL